jgi:hypothetical protein
MGADQVGYLWTQPMAYDEANLRAVLTQRFQELRTELEHAQAQPKDISSTEQEAKRRSAERFPRLERIRSWAGFACIADAIQVWSERILAVDVVEQVLNHLTTLPGRDTTSRDDVDHPSRRLCFAGEMTWGDEPTGFGYRCMQIIYAADLTGPLDIR